MGTQSQTRCTGSARDLGQTTVQTAQPGLHNQQTTQRRNPQLTLLLMDVIVILEEPLSIQGDLIYSRFMCENFPLKRCHDCGNDPWGCLGCQACGVQDCRYEHSYVFLNYKGKTSQKKNIFSFGHRPNPPPKRAIWAAFLLMLLSQK